MEGNLKFEIKRSINIRNLNIIEIRTLNEKRASKCTGNLKLKTKTDNIFDTNTKNNRI